MKKICLLIIVSVILFAVCSVYAEEAPLFSTFGEAVNAVEYTVSGEGYAVALIEKDGRFFRVIASLDETGKELYEAFLNASGPETMSFPADEWDSVFDHVMTLPVEKTEELTIVPFTQEELDAMAGKTIADVMSEPWEMGMMNYPEEADANGDVVFPMVKGFCKYDLVINESFEEYQERRSRDHYDPVTVLSLKNYEDLTVRYMKYAGLSGNTTNLLYLADGTRAAVDEPVFENYDLMTEIADILAPLWENGEPDPETKEAMIAELTEEHPEAADMIREIVDSYYRSDD